MTVLEDCQVLLPMLSPCICSLPLPASIECVKTNTHHEHLFSAAFGVMCVQYTALHQALLCFFFCSSFFLLVLSSIWKFLFSFIFLTRVLFHLLLISKEISNRPCFLLPCWRHTISSSSPRTFPWERPRRTENSLHQLEDSPDGLFRQYQKYLKMGHVTKTLESIKPLQNFHTVGEISEII